MKRILFYLAIIMVASILLFYFLGNKVLRNQKENGFVRDFRELKLSVLNVLELSDRSFRLLSIDSNRVVLNKYSDILHLYQADLSLEKLDTIDISFPKRFKSDAFNIYKDTFDARIYCTNPYGDILIYQKDNSKYFKFTQFRFDFFQATSPTSLIVRGRHPNHRQDNRYLAKLAIHDSVSLKREFVFPEVKDGLFANDGLLYYHRPSAKILYMYYYKGEFIALDTNLKQLYTQKTIDTVRFANIKTKILSGENGKLPTLTQVQPPKIVQSNIAAHNNKLYILSKLRSENESQHAFNANNVVDSYDLNTGKYLFSFYIPKYKYNKLAQFQISNNVLWAIYGNYLVKYKLNSSDSTL